MIQTKTVDITPMKITLPVIEMSQYDLGRQVIVHMKDGSDWFDLTGYTAKLQGTKPSGFGYTVNGVVDGHDITFASSYDMTSEAGFIPSEVRLTKDGVSLGSLNVILHVEKTPHDATVTDGSPETIIPEMTELVERAEAAAEVLLDCSATATTLPAGSNATASYDVDNGVFTFGIPRGNKGETGETGNGIASITKTGTSGLVDTYTIAYTDGTTTTFTVTNGRNGTGSVADVWQNGVSVLDGSTAKVTVPVLDVTQNGTSVLDGTTAKVVVPTKTSDLTNDSGFVTSVPTKTSDLTNDSNFVSDGSYVHTDNNYTSTEKSKLSGIAAGAEVNVQSDWNQTTTTADDYIKNKPTIPTVPTNVSEFTNDAGYLTGDDVKIKNFSSFADVGLDATATVNDVFTAMPAYSRISISLASTATIATELGFADGGVIDILKMNDWRGQAIATSYSTYKTKVGNILAQDRMYWRTMGVLELSVASFSSLPQTITNSAISDDMVCVKAELGTPSAQTGDWTVTTSNGSLTISGSISGSTTATLYLAIKQ